MPTFRHVLFDAGGTLLDVEYRHLREAVARAGNGASSAADDGGSGGAPGNGVPTEEQLARGEESARRWFLGHVGRGGIPADAWNGYFERVLAGAGVPEQTVREVLPLLWERNLASGLWHRPVPRAAETLGRLRGAGLRLAVISNAEGRVAADLAEAGLDGFFDEIVDSHRVGVAKPDPRIFAIALERLGAAPSDSVYVGDVFEIDVRGARAAGLPAILVDRWDLQPHADCPRVARLEEIGPLLGA